MDYNLQLIEQVKNRLAELPQDQYWQIPLDGANYLAKTVSTNKPNLILEIGTSSGYSAICMADALIKSQNLKAQIITIESHAARFQFSQDNFKKCNLNHLITGYKGHAPEIFSEIAFPAPIDLAFFDGTKSQTTDFFTAIYPLLSKGGIILVDNVLSHQEKMQPFIDYLQNQKHQYQILDIGAGICQITKSA